MIVNNKKEITNEMMSNLRKQKILESEEIAFFEGDLLVAENVITKVRRLIPNHNEILLETSKKLLKD